MTAKQLLTLVREYGIAVGQYHDARHAHNAEGATNAHGHADALLDELRTELYRQERQAAA